MSEGPLEDASNAKEIPVFCGCGVTPQAVAEKARVELVITHEPGQAGSLDPRRGR